VVRVVSESRSLTVDTMGRAGEIAATADPVDRLAALFDAHHDPLYRLARRMVADAEEARDLVQEAFLRAARKAGSIPSDDAGARRPGKITIDH